MSSHRSPRSSPRRSPSVKGGAPRRLAALRPLGGRACGLGAGPGRQQLGPSVVYRPPKLRPISIAARILHSRNKHVLADLDSDNLVLTTEISTAIRALLQRPLDQNTPQSPPSFLTPTSSPVDRLTRLVVRQCERPESKLHPPSPAHTTSGAIDRSRKAQTVVHSHGSHAHMDHLAKDSYASGRVSGSGMIAVPTLGPVGGCGAGSSRHHRPGRAEQTRGRGMIRQAVACADTAPRRP